ncbi:hypothetical protein [Pseudorhodoferax sp.]|jgi:uncharacterized membrane protein YccC|uniref:hypothetical protein n=1 Tax=Pseudorhodoferax sp. TaxID=1993553 RepID=UPI001B446716|nr:hypothetical protein [Pseudorhodoferax sp.]MBP8144218.1 hypothetical protein [Inhella sp.]
MNPTQAPLSTPLPPLLTELEAALSMVQQALSTRDARLLEQQAGRVQALMQQGLEMARGHALDPEWRRRLAACGAQMAAQRQALFRATSALDRAIEVLMPAETSGSGLYGESGRSLRQRSSGDSLTA